MNQERGLDGYDRKILRALSADGRVSWRDLAGAIGLTLTPTLRRVRRLEADGYIRGYAAQLDEDKLAGGMTVFVSVTLERQVEAALSAFETAVAAMPEIVGGFQMTGGSDYLLHTMVRSLEHYQEVLTRLTRTPGVAHVESSFALKAFVRRSSLEAGALS